MSLGDLSRRLRKMYSFASILAQEIFQLNSKQKLRCFIEIIKQFKINWRKITVLIENNRIDCQVDVIYWIVTKFICNLNYIKSYSVRMFCINKSEQN